MSQYNEKYWDALRTQGDLTTCPDCVARGERKHLCRNPVVLKVGGERKLVCCYLGDRDQIEREEFCKKVDELKALKK